MSNKSNTINDLNLLAATSGAGGSSQDRLAALLEVKLAKEMKEEKEKVDQEDAARRASVAAAKKAQEERILAQAQCPHMKPNFRPATGGQKDSKGDLHMVCQYCGKEFGNNLPFHLRIPAEMVGGPQ